MTASSGFDKGYSMSLKHKMTKFALKFSDYGILIVPCSIIRASGSVTWVRAENLGITTVSSDRIYDNYREAHEAHEAIRRGF